MKKSDKMNKFLLKTKKELDKFFGIKLPVPKIIYVNSRKEINKLRGKKTEDWLIAWVKKGCIFALKPEKYETESSHNKPNFPRYCKIMKHEMIHLYYQKLAKMYKPLWFHEGLAVYLAKQTYMISEENVEKAAGIIKYYSKFNREVYKYGSKVVKLLYEKHGKKKLLQLIKSLNSRTNKKEFAKKFKKVYGFDLNKKSLIKNLK